MATDEELILEFQRGSREAFEELFHRYREQMYAFFRRRLDDASRAEELAQDTFIAVLRGREHYEPRALVRTYLYGIALKLLAVERRQAARKYSETAIVFQATNDPDPGLWVRQAIAKLDAETREILLLREYEQLSYAEIAALLRIPLNTVRSRLFRSRVELRGLLESSTKVKQGIQNE